jgi:outer membrane scaffolding protein for murein synthesis (MipA/OmpV family)
MTGSGMVGTGSGLTGGVSTTVFGSERWDFGVGLRLTSGRNSAGDARLSGLPDIDPSVALRAALRYQLSPHWQLSAGVQQDVLEQQGLKAQIGLSWSHPVWANWDLDLSSGLAWANGRAMRTFYGVPMSAATAQRPAWVPTSGWESWFVGAALSRPLGQHWRVAGSVGHSSLVGQAAHSPLTQRRDGAVASFSVAYVGW